jgi:hypothetical protein
LEKSGFGKQIKDGVQDRAEKQFKQTGKNKQKNGGIGEPSAVGGSENRSTGVLLGNG